MNALCTDHVYGHSFELPAWMPRHQVQRIKRSGLTLILRQMRLDGVEPDWSSLDIQIAWSSRTGACHQVDTTISALKESA